MSKKQTFSPSLCSAAVFLTRLFSLLLPSWPKHFSLYASSPPLSAFLFNNLKNSFMVCLCTHTSHNFCVSQRIVRNSEDMLKKTRVLVSSFLCQCHFVSAFSTSSSFASIQMRIEHRACSVFPKGLCTSCPIAIITSVLVHFN